MGSNFFRHLLPPPKKYRSPHYHLIPEVKARRRAMKWYTLLFVALCWGGYIVVKVKQSRDPLAVDTPHTKKPPLPEMQKQIPIVPLHP